MTIDVVAVVIVVIITICIRRYLHMSVKINVRRVGNQNTRNTQRSH